MSKVYAGCDFELVLTSNITLTAATTLEIHYIKPGTDEAVVTGLTAAASGTTATVDITDLINTASDYGTWKFWIHAVIDTKIYKGETFKKLISKVGR